MPDRDPMVHSRETRQLLMALREQVDLKFSHIHEALGRIEKSNEERITVQEKAFDEVKTILKWAGALLTTLILSVLGWALTQQYEANEAQSRELKQQVEILQQRQQLQTANEALTSGGAKPPDASVGGR